MPRAVSQVPVGQSRPVPYLIVRGGTRAIEFYQAALGAAVTMRIEAPSGSIGHAELTVGEGAIMLADEFPDMGALSPESLGGSPVTIHLYVPDVDDTAARMVSLGAKMLRPVADQFYGDRGGKLQDPFGHVWWIASRLEDLTPEEIQQRASALFGG